MTGDSVRGGGWGREIVYGIPYSAQNGLYEAIGNTGFGGFKGGRCIDEQLCYKE